MHRLAPSMNMGRGRRVCLGHNIAKQSDSIQKLIDAMLYMQINFTSNMPLENANIYIFCNGYGRVALISMESITEAALIYMATSIHAAVGKMP